MFIGTTANNNTSISKHIVIPRSSGNVGIGESGPDFRLQVATPAESTDPISFAFDITRENSSNRGMTFGMATNDTFGAIGTHNADLRFGHTFGTESNGQPAFYPTLTIEHVDQAVGNVGIGTTNPSSILHLESASSPTLTIQDTTGTDTVLKIYSQDSNAHVGTYSNHDLIFDSNSTERMRITSGGDVDITNDLIVDGNATIDFSLLGRAFRSANRGELHLNATATNDVSEIFFGYGAGYTESNIRWGISDRGTSNAKLEFYRGPALGGFSSVMTLLGINKRVGIGTSSPVAKFEVTDGSSSITLQEFNNGAAIFLDGSNGDFVGGDYFHIIADGVGYLGLGGYGGGATPLNINYQGRVGVGTNSPSNLFHVSGSNNSTPVRFEIGSNANYYFKANSTSGYATTFNMDDTGLDIGHNSSSRSLNLQTNSTDRLTILGGGNVGIGNSSPQNTLHLGNQSTNSAGTLRIDSFVSGQFWKLEPGTNTLNVKDYGGTSLISFDGSTNNVIFNGGDVGIGTDDPKELLHIRQEGTVSNYYDEGALQVGGTTNGIGALLSYHGQSSGRLSLSSLYNVGGNNATLSFGFGAMTTSGRPTNEVLTVNQSGNVGIGTLNPASISSTAHWLTLNADSGSSASGGIIHQVNGTTKGALYVFGSNVYHDAKSGVGHTFAVNNGTTAMQINSDSSIDITGNVDVDGILEVNPNGYYLYFNIDGNTRNLMRMDNSGTQKWDCRLNSNGNLEWRDFNGTETFDIQATLAKQAGSFKISHPDPAKTETEWLYHSFVESPTAGDNIYRWQVETVNGTATIELPDYYKHLNENDQVWVSAFKHFGQAYGEVNEGQTTLTITSNQDGKYNVLLIGTRKDEAAVNAWKGTERLKT